MPVPKEEAPSYLATHTGPLGQGWSEVDTFDTLDPDEYEPEEVRPSLKWANADINRKTRKSTLLLIWGLRWIQSGYRLRGHISLLYVCSSGGL
jgi:hypothetical protein